jgi:hypothetical protein
VVEHVAVDDGRVDAAKIEQVVDVVEGNARPAASPTVQALILCVFPSSVGVFSPRGAARPLGATGATSTGLAAGAPRPCGGTCAWARVTSEPTDTRIASPATARMTGRIPHSFCIDFNAAGMLSTRPVVRA